MSAEALRAVCAPGSSSCLPPLPPLCCPSLDAAAASTQLELEIRYLLAEHRKVTRCLLLPFLPLLSPLKLLIYTHHKETVLIETAGVV